jgi:hypothetical protein
MKKQQNRRQWTKAAATALIAGLAGDRCATKTSQSAPIIPSPVLPATTTTTTTTTQCTESTTPLLRVQVVKCADGTKGVRFHPTGGLDISKRLPPKPKFAFLMLDPGGCFTDDITVKQIADSSGVAHNLDDVFESGHPGSSFVLRKNDPPIRFQIKETLKIKERCSFADDTHQYARGIYFRYTDSDGTVLDHCDHGNHTDIHIEC